MSAIVTPFLIFLITIPFICYVLTQHRDQKVVELLMIGFILRVALMIVDLNHIFPIPHSGADTEGLHYYARSNQYLNEARHLTNYTVILTFLYSLTDSSRVFGQYFNVILGMGVLCYLYECLKLINVEKRVQHRVLTIAVFMPHLIIFSGILLREAWCQLFITISLYYFLKWFMGRGGPWHLIVSLACVFGASWMHGGCIAVAGGYSMAYLFYNPSKKSNSFSYRSVLSAIAIFVFLSIFATNMDVLGGKFAKYQNSDVEEVFVSRSNVVDREESGSDYLTWLPHVNNPLIGLLFTPLRMFYYLYSPIPFDWRGMSDIIAFIMDSIFYLYFSWKLFRVKIRKKQIAHLRNYMILVYMLVTFVFAYGTSVAGTAIRHRCKSVTVLLVAYATTQAIQLNEIDSKRKKRIR